MPTHAPNPLTQPLLAPLNVRDYRMLALVAVLQCLVLTPTQMWCESGSWLQRYGSYVGFALPIIPFFFILHRSEICDWPFRIVRMIPITLLAALATAVGVGLSILLAATLGPQVAIELLCILAIALLITWPRQVMLKISRFVGDPRRKLEDRSGAIYFLLCANAIAAISCWYPSYVAGHYSAPDDRFGFLLLFALPFWLVAPGIAAWALFSLLKSTVRQMWNVVNVFYTLAGMVLALGCFSPVLMLAYRLIRLRDGE